MSKKAKCIVAIIVVLIVLAVVVFFNIEQKVMPDNYIFDDTIFVKLYSPHFEREYADKYEFDEKHTKDLLDILHSLKGKRVFYSNPYYSWAENDIWVGVTYVFIDKKTNAQINICVMVGSEAVVFVGEKCYLIKDNLGLYEDMKQILNIK